MENQQFKKLIKEALTPDFLKKSVNEAKEKKLNKDLGNIRGTFGEDNFDKEDAEVYDVKPGKYMKFYIEDESNSSILKVKRIAKENGLKFVKDLDDMLLFKESVNEVFDPEGDYDIQYEIEDYERGDEVVVLPSLSHDPLNKQGETGEVFDVDTFEKYVIVKFDDGQIGDYLVGQVVFPGDENYRHPEDEGSMNA
tara:strand:+ start:162 stop:746 length:585 start_codon:yes stop_codon:yes gene_type:complete